MPETTVEALVEGGKATAGPPIGPALGPLGVNIMQVIKKINERTKSFKGMSVPVKIIVDDKTKEFRITVGTPPTSSLIKTELGISSASKEPGNEMVGNITIEQAKKIADMKDDVMYGKDLKNKVKVVLGTCVSMGITCEGKHPKEVCEEISKGLHDDKF